MNKRFLLWIMLIILSITFISCAKTQDINQNKTVIVGFDDTFVPMGFKNDNGEIVGFDIDLANEIFKRLNMNVKFQPIDWSMKEAELNSNNIDLIWNGYTITEERKEKVEFTKPYMENRQVIVVLKSSDIKTKNDLEGKKVAVQTSSSSQEAVEKDKDFVKKLDGGKLYLYENNNDALMELENSRVDAVVADEILARYYIKLKGEDRFRILEEDFGKEEYGIGLRKQDKELKDKLDKMLDELKKDGTFDKIYSKWFSN